MKKWLKPMLILALVVGSALTARFLGLDRQLGALRDWIGAQGVWGPFLFAGLYALATVFAIPGSALTIAAGALFGSVIGVITVICGATLGATFCFLIA
ncbi:MAG: TVP38/TMEM64 family protein, partial [Lentisphaerae bacterium]